MNRGCMSLRLLGGDSRFFRQHNGYVVANRINAPARLTLQASAVRRRLNRGLAHGADKNLEQLLRDGHWHPPRLLLRTVLALYQSGRGRANVTFACWWLGRVVLHRKPHETEEPCRRV